MMTEQLYNKKCKEELERDLETESFSRITLSFYKYVNIDNINGLRDELYLKLSELKVLGRIYIANEGINVQISIPKKNKSKFVNFISSIQLLSNIHIKEAVEDGISFYKLKIKIKNEIVAYDINKNDYDMDHVGRHLSPDEFNNAIENSECTVVDIRNYYESEVGHFKGAILPNVQRSQDLLPKVAKLLENKKNKKILLYCTGGIRCEKASSYLIKKNFTDVNQLDGGIINYANQIKRKKIKSKFIGKNFVFDNRLGERITNDVISNCHQCENKNDIHKNCKNDLCHILFIQCEKCNKKFDGCCSKECQKFNQLTYSDKKKKKKEFLSYNEKRLGGKIKPKLRDMIN